jgi:predicted DNA-binding transcriptional regulator AlpA
MAAIEVEQHLKEQEVADLLQISVSTLRHWRVERTGPPAIKVSNRVRYPASGLQAYLNGCPQVGGPSSC